MYIEIEDKFKFNERTKNKKKIIVKFKYLDKIKSKEYDENEELFPLT